MTIYLGDYLFENNSCLRKVFRGRKFDGRGCEPYNYEVLGHTCNPSQEGRALKIGVLDKTI